MHTRLRLAVVGLGFGAEFVPIYLAHPDVEEVGICAHQSALDGGAAMQIPRFDDAYHKEIRPGGNRYPA